MGQEKFTPDDKGKAIDLRSTRFGKLVAVSTTFINGVRGWLCKCDCGGSIEVPTFQLTGGYVVQCASKWHTVGLNKGGRVGSLVIQDYVPPKSRPDYEVGRKGLRGYYLCSCDCGSTDVRIFAKNLQRGKVNCGCSKRSIPKKPIEEVLCTYLFGNYRRNAETKNYQFSIEKEIFRDIIFSPCHYCGGFDERGMKHREEKINCNGVDRISSNDGYTENNVLPCCMGCNYLKNNTSYEDFLDKIGKIYNNCIKDKRHDH